MVGCGSRFHCKVYHRFGDIVGAVYTAEEILEIAGGRLAAGNLEPEAGAISTDTRRINEGDWFVALEGQKYDGHDFLGDAFASGAIGAIVAERTSYAIGSQSFPLIAVEAPGAALSRLARNWRRRISPQTIVVSGDSKDSTKLIQLMQAAAVAQSLEPACLPNCAKARDAAEFVLNMPEESKLLIVGLSPSDLSEVENAAIALEANVLSFLPLAFDNLRLTSEAHYLREAKVSLMRNLNRMWGWILSTSSEAEQLA